MGDDSLWSIDWEREDGGTYACGEMVAAVFVGLASIASVVFGIFVWAGAA